MTYNNYTHSDVDECEVETSLCTHNCHNSIGSYECSCSTLYILSSNGHGCDATISIAAIVGSMGGLFLFVILFTFIGIFVCLCKMRFNKKKNVPSEM